MTTARSGTTDSRLTRLEAAQEALTNDVREVARSVQALAVTTRDDNKLINDSLRNQSDRTNQSIQSLADRLATSKQTHWGTVASFIAVAVAIIGGIGAALLRPMDVKDSSHDAQLTQLHQSEKTLLEEVFKLRERVAVQEAITELTRQLQHTAEK